ncbi:hypothetical protein TWF569_000575 [Orbilia oligospora]|uniref:DUF6593 domain-containing protein n=1 Tax=Orbilia oligospora TaxID=2813651 RepID=A0A7C8N678_ORBOL|nr:hypothetical protein TWF102_010260 [Orbilia oligospora]KAF3089693.1 hypothetical protein TWF706_010307 [Orbilia oligospora]KAF3108784.1 hypothetical protein TWF103_005383 [Orbilia oligospora]KAF3126303.1 hypothetical protein TWF569_000575 [Orbilia oligospora]KAF3150976.1 hypothetical protein TWF594_008194 [Orbilia oligospora]
MTFSSFLSKLEEKASGSSSHPQPQQYNPQNPQHNPPNPQYNDACPPFQPQFQSYQGPAYNQNQFPNAGNQPVPSNYYYQPIYNNPPQYTPQYAPSPSHAPQPQQQYHKPATKSLLLSYSSVGTATSAKDPDTKEQLYIVTYPKYDGWTGKSKSGLDHELHVGDKKGQILGGWKSSDLTGKPSICIGEPKNGAQFQKLRSSSSGTKMGFTSPHNGREYGWKKGGEKMAFRLVDIESGEEVAAFDPSNSSMSLSKLGKLEIQLIGGEDWVAAVLITIVILVDQKVDDEIGKEVLQAVLGA